jgi:hypothetical protein
MHLVHLWLKTLPPHAGRSGGAPLGDLTGRLGACEEVDFVVLHESADGQPVVGMYLQARSAEHAELVAGQLWQRASAQVPEGVSWAVADIVSPLGRAARLFGGDGGAAPA